MNFIFECSTRYLTSERSERVRYRVEHERIKFISTSGHVIFCLLYKHRINSCEKGAIYYVAITRVISSPVKIYMLFAGWEVRIVKNCDRGLENAARGRRPRAAFSSPRSQFFTIRTDPRPANNFFFFPALIWLTIGFTQLCY